MNTPAALDAPCTRRLAVVRHPHGGCVSCRWLLRFGGIVMQTRSDSPSGEALTPRMVVRAAVRVVVTLAVLFAVYALLPADNRAPWVQVLVFVALMVALVASTRSLSMGVVGLAGAVLTIIGFTIGTGPSGWVVLAALAVTLLGIAAAVLIAQDLPNPTNLAAEGRRILFTLIGVAIAVAVMYLADLLQQRTPTERGP